VEENLYSGRKVQEGPDLLQKNSQRKKTPKQLKSQYQTSIYTK